MWLTKSALKCFNYLTDPLSDWSIIWLILLFDWSYYLIDPLSYWSIICDLIKRRPLYKHICLHFQIIKHPSSIKFQAYFLQQLTTSMKTRLPPMSAAWILAPVLIVLEWRATPSVENLLEEKFKIFKFFPIIW